MTLRVGRLGCPPNCLCKIISGFSPLKVLIKEPTNLTNPTFTYSLSDDELVLNIIGSADYAILQTDTYGMELYNYYFIDSIVSVASGFIEINCHLDVLTQNAFTIITALKNGNMILSRCGTKKRSDEEPLQDSMISLAGRDASDFDKREFNAAFTWEHPWYILVASGGELGDENSTSTS